MKSALLWETVASCSTTKARVAKLALPHGIVDTPVFMPVATQASLKGLTTQQLVNLGCQIMLNNTYHLVIIQLMLHSSTWRVSLISIPRDCDPGKLYWRRLGVHTNFKPGKGISSR
jgi:hypothetical protein